MNRPTVLAIALLSILPWLAACGSRDGNDSTAADSAAEATEETRSSIARALVEAREEVRKEVREGDISLNSDDKNVPKAKITPRGDLVIDGREVAIDDEQRALLLQYRERVADVAEAGAEVGLHAAGIATDAVGEAIKGLFTGGGEEDIEKRIEADVEEKIKASVVKLCEQLPPLLETEQALVAALPEFAPYADMDEGDIDDCMDGDGKASVDDTERAAKQQEIRENIRDATRSGIRTTVQRIAQGAGLASSGTTDDQEAKTTTDDATGTP